MAEYAEWLATKEEHDHLEYWVYDRRPDSLNNPDARDWTAVRTVPWLTELTVSGDRTDDDVQAKMPALPYTRHLFIGRSNIIGSFLGKRPMPNVSSITILGAPVPGANE